MTETYQDILDEIENLSSVSKGGISCPIQLYADNHSIEGACEGADDCGIKVLKHLAERVHDAVACDMNEWYQLDKNGEPVHIGDEVRADFSTKKVLGFFKHGGEAYDWSTACFVLADDMDDSWCEMGFEDCEACEKDQFQRICRSLDRLKEMVLADDDLLEGVRMLVEGGLFSDE